MVVVWGLGAVVWLASVLWSWSSYGSRAGLEH